MNAPASSTDRGGRPRVCSLVSPFNSGSNFLQRFLGVNDLPIAPAPANWLLFKHYPPSLQQRIATDRQLNLSRLVFLILWRDPYRWYEAMQRTPYEMVFTSPFDPCRIELHAINHDVTYEQRLLGYEPRELNTWFTFPSVIEYWQAFYREALAWNPPGGIVFVRYEDLLETPERVLPRLAAALHLPTPERLVIPLASAKDHGVSRGFAQARAKLRAEATDPTREQKRLSFLSAFDSRLLGDLARASRLPAPSDDR